MTDETEDPTRDLLAEAEAAGTDLVIWQAGRGIVRYGKRYALPKHFSGHFSGPNYRIDLQLEISDAGRVVCRTFTCKAMSGEPVTGTMLRDVPLATYVRRAVDRMLQQVNDTDGRLRFERVGTLPDADQALAEFRSEYRDLVGEPIRRGVPVTDRRLRQVAEVYRDAFNRGLPPTKTVADLYEVARSTAARWVSESRKRGFLGPTEKRKAGEIQPPKED